jgi:hypothetical protein
MKTNPLTQITDLLMSAGALNPPAASGTGNTAAYGTVTVQCCRNAVIMFLENHKTCWQPMCLTLIKTNQKPVQSPIKI